jgi:hypothetical protein
VFAVEDANLHKLAETPIDRGLDVFCWEDGGLTPGAKLAPGSGSAAINTAWP